MATPAVSQPRSSSSSSMTESYVDNKCKEDIRQANIITTRAIVDTVRSSLSPKGMDKMISTAGGNAIVTILNKMEVFQLAAKILIKLSKSQDSAANDGTTTVVELAMKD